MDAITGVLAKELGPRNIRVNAILPGMVQTEGTVAKVAVFLASNDSGWLTATACIRKAGQMQAS